VIGRIVEIAQDGRHLAVDRGFMTVSERGAEVGRVPLDDIGMVIVNAHGITYSNNLIVKLAERGAGVVVCGANHSPVAWLWPVVGHHDQATRLRAQIGASKPLVKRLWQALVKAKVRQQGAVLNAMGKTGAGFELMAARVNSGDPDNMEAQAARRYWPLLLGDDFRRDRDSGGVNALLNYGYAVMRATTARAVCAAGLHPSIGLQHKNGDMCLVDDLMEPFRPMVDLVVARLAVNGTTAVSRDAKKALADVTSLDMRTDKGRTPVFLCLERLAASLGKSFEAGRPVLDLPLEPLPLELPAVGSEEADDAALQEA
jgi:CRISPR-associated protein Cas1